MNTSVNFKEIADKLISELEKKEIEAYVWHVAKTGSVYIRFSDSRMCSVRLGDHNGRSKLKYKYNLRSDIKPDECGWKKDDGTWRYYLSIKDWRKMVYALEDRHHQIQDWPESKFKYTIPKYKQKK